MTLIIILARGGSKGVPGKNTMLIGGRPCITWTIEHALATAKLNNSIDVVVSTDDPAAAAIAAAMGVLVHNRPAHLATDNARVDDAARAALDWFSESVIEPQRVPTRVVILYGNVPVRPHDITYRCVDLLETSGCDSVQSYVTVGKNHPYWTAKLNVDGSVRPWEGDVLNHGIYRRQALPDAYIPDGACIAVTAAALRGLPECHITTQPHAFFGNDRRGVTTLPGEVVDIDSPIDAIVADAVLTRNLMNQSPRYNISVADSPHRRVAA